jgi:hypothetical protein
MNEWMDGWMAFDVDVLAGWDRTACVSCRLLDEKQTNKQTKTKCNATINVTYQQR